MKNRGFTLVELLATIAILAVVALITVPTISNSINKYKNSLYENQINQILSAAKVWASDNIGILPNDTNSEIEIDYTDIQTGNIPENYKKLTITLSLLQQNGYISKEIKNNKTGELFDENITIDIIKNNSKLDYEINTNTYDKLQVGDKVIVKVDATTEKTFYVIKDSLETEKEVDLILATSEVQTKWCNEGCAFADWEYAKDIRLITTDEINYVLNITKNDSDKGNWLYNENIWISSTSDAPQYLSMTGIVSNETSTDVEYNLKPVITINKNYVRITN